MPLDDFVCRGASSWCPRAHFCAKTSGPAAVVKKFAVGHPPYAGTGKTGVLVAIIRAAVAQGQSVLASAPSNAAVDNLVERLSAQGLRVVRLGNPERVSKDALEHTLSMQVSLIKQLAQNLSQPRSPARIFSDCDPCHRVVDQAISPIGMNV